MNGLCANKRLLGVLACSAGPAACRGPRRARRHAARGAGFASGCPICPWTAGVSCTGNTDSAQKAGARRRGASKKRRGLAPKKSHPPGWVLQVAQFHRKITLSSVVATSTFYARTRDRLRLRSQLFKKNRKVSKSQKSTVSGHWSLVKSQQSVGKR